MSFSVIHGLPSAQLVAGPDLNIKRATDGRFTGSLTFRCSKDDFDTSTIQGLLQKGTPLADVYVYAPSLFPFLVIDDWDASQQPGGFVEISCTLVGQPDGGDVDTNFDNETTSLAYSRTTSVQIVSIFEHPQFKKDFSYEEQKLMKMWSDGTLMENPSATADVGDMVYAKNDAEAGSFESDNLSNFNKWASIIIANKILTWEAPVSEWTKSATIKTLIPDAEIAEVGQAPVTPDLEPTAPNGQTWRLTGINEDITMTGVNRTTVAANAFSKTWTSGFYNAELFNHEDFGPSTTGEY